MHHQSPDALIAASRLPRAEARRLLEHASGRRREWLLAHGDEPVDTTVCERFLTLEERRVNGEPMAYLCGEREFHGLALRIDSAVLIPRPETELLVDEARRLAPHGAMVLDLGTGSGAIAIALATQRVDLSLVATDRSAPALAVAHQNALHHGISPQRLALREGHWWQAVDSAERFDLIVSNPPYIADTDPHLVEGDLRFEPISALASGPDGLNALREITIGAPTHLASAGWLAVEHGWNQGAAVRALFTQAGLADVRTRRDLAGHERVTLGRAP